MDQLAEIENIGLSLAQLVRREVSLYQAHSSISKFHAVLDDDHQCYSIIVVEKDRSLDVPVWVFMMARLQNEFVVIEEDTSLNKHLYDALMVNAGIPREKIILAYKGEKLPDESSSQEKA